MDLLEGSDAEDYNLEDFNSIDENALLGSDDEDTISDSMQSKYMRNSKRLSTRDSDDVLDIELGDDGALDFDEEKNKKDYSLFESTILADNDTDDVVSSKIIEANRSETELESLKSAESLSSQDSGFHKTVMEDDDETEEEDKSSRSRFVSERQVPDSKDKPAENKNKKGVIRHPGQKIFHRGRNNRDFNRSNFNMRNTRPFGAPNNRDGFRARRCADANTMNPGLFIGRFNQPGNPLIRQVANQIVHPFLTIPNPNFTLRDSSLISNPQNILPCPPNIPWNPALAPPTSLPIGGIPATVESFIRVSSTLTGANVVRSQNNPLLPFNPIKKSLPSQVHANVPAMPIDCRNFPTPNFCRNGMHKEPSRRGPGPNLGLIRPIDALPNKPLRLPLNEHPNPRHQMPNNCAHPDRSWNNFQAPRHAQVGPLNHKLNMNDLVTPDNRFSAPTKDLLHTPRQGPLNMVPDRFPSSHGNNAIRDKDDEWLRQVEEFQRRLESSETRSSRHHHYRERDRDRRRSLSKSPPRKHYRDASPNYNCEKQTGKWQNDEKSMNRKEEFHKVMKEQHGSIHGKEEDKQKEKAHSLSEESKKVVGLDDDYLKKLEQQKRLREEILRKKEQRRRLNVQKESGEIHVSNNKPADADDKKTVKKDEFLKQKVLKAPDHPISSQKSDLKTVQAPSKSINDTSNKKNNKIEKVSAKSSKPKTILRIVRNKKGEIISKSKVIVLPKSQKDVETPSTSSTASSS